MAEWWVNLAADNLLKGVVGDPDNPLRMSSSDIVYHLRRSPEARESFNRLVPTMLPEERQRLEALAAGQAKYLQPGVDTASEVHQQSLNRRVVRTTGRYGGSRRGGNAGRR